MPKHSSLVRYSFHVQPSVMDAAKRRAREQSELGANKVTRADVLREFLADGLKLREMRDAELEREARRGTEAERADRQR